MKIELARYTSGRRALADLDSSIGRLECRRPQGAQLDDLVTLSEHLFLRGDVLGRIADHECADAIAGEAVALFPTDAAALVLRARVAVRFHRFGEAHALLDRAMVVDRLNLQIMDARAALLQATGQFWEALEMRDRLAREDRGIHTLGALATLSAETGQWAMAEMLYAEALGADDGISPFPCAQVLFEWGVGAMRNGAPGRAEERFAQLETILPGHVPGRGHRAAVALARGDLETAGARIQPLLAASDDPGYRALHAEILAARGEHVAAAIEAQRAAAAYTALLARRPEAYAGHAAAFLMGVGDHPLRAVELAAYDRALRDTPGSRALFARAQQVANARRAVHASRRIAPLKSDRAATLR